MTLELLSGDFSVCQLDNTDKADLTADFVFLSKTDSEISLVCETSFAPESALKREDGWRAFRVRGTLDFALVGILAKISGALAASGIGIFAISTYDTDYILVKARDVSQAAGALNAAGYTVE